MTPADATATDDAVLEAARRVDWRFLLADPRLGRVLLVGDVAGPELEALRVFSESVTVTSTPAAQDLGSAFDVAVVRQPTRLALQVAARALTADGVLYVEVEPRTFRGRRRSLRPAAVRAALESLDLRSIAPAWHWPDFQSCTRIVPLTSAENLRYVARVNMAAPPALEAPAGALLRAGVSSLPAAAVSIVARRTGPPTNLAAEYLTLGRDELQLRRRGIGEHPALVLVTPRFKASGHVIYLALAEGTSTPALALKVPRLPGTQASLDREARRLGTIQAARPGGFDSIPAVVAYEEYRGHRVLVQSALQGTPMDRRAVRRDSHRCCGATLSWLVEVHCATRTAAESDWHARLIALPLERLAHVLGPDPWRRALVDSTRAAADSLGHAAPSLVFEHGDLSHPNLLVTPAGRLGVLDWETANPAGLPACDLFFFLAYIASARRRRWSTATELAAFDEAFFGPSAWTRPYVRDYAAALDLPPSTLVPLFLLTWPRYLASLVERLHHDVDGGAASRLGDWLGASRVFSLWRHAMAHAHRLDWHG
jgi:aminoglycoside phosphotransferase